MILQNAKKPRIFSSLRTENTECPVGLEMSFFFVGDQNYF